MFVSAISLCKVGCYWARLAAPSFFGAFQWPPPYLAGGPPLVIATLPAVTLAFSLKVSLTSLSFKSLVAAVLLASIDLSVATVEAASATALSKTYLDSSGFPSFWTRLAPSFLAGGGAFQYCVDGPPLIIATLPAVTLAFSLNVSLISLLSKSLLAATLLFSLECSSATIWAASATYFSKSALD